MKTLVIDYGMGNLFSVSNALRFLGADVRISSNFQDVAQADALVLPGVGSFRAGMRALRQRGLDDAIREAVEIRQRKVLGICLGFQMLAEYGSEDGGSEGLGYLPTAVDLLHPQQALTLKLPHIGFNQVWFANDSPLFRGVESGAYFYFVHSFRVLPNSLLGKVATAHYGEDFVAAYSSGNIFGAQFHPEKSQTNGLRFLQNFLETDLC